MATDEGSWGVAATQRLINSDESWDVIKRAVDQEMPSPAACRAVLGLPADVAHMTPVVDALEAAHHRIVQQATRAQTARAFREMCSEASKAMQSATITVIDEPLLDGADTPTLQWGPAGRFPQVIETVELMFLGTAEQQAQQDECDTPVIVDAKE